MMSLHHPNCVRCYEVLETPKHVILALEMAENDLFSLYERPGKYTERDAARNVKDMAAGIAYLHSKNIVHRDLKVLPLPPCAPRPPLRPRCPPRQLENILVGSGNVLKMCAPAPLELRAGDLRFTAARSRVRSCDFGFARALKSDDTLKTACGTPEYVAPEVLLGGGEEAYTNKCDIWSLGVTTFMMLSGPPPLPAVRGVQPSAPASRARCRPQASGRSGTTTR